MDCLPSAVLLALALCLAPSLTGAAIYKWVDENGKVHYSDKPPADAATEMDIETGEPGTGPSLTDTQRKAKRDKLLDAFRKEREDKAAAEAEARKQKKEREAWCRQAKEELAKMRTAGYLYDYDDDGNKVIYSDAQRAAATREHEEQIARLC